MYGGTPPRGCAVQVTLWPKSAVNGETVQDVESGLELIIKLKLVLLPKGCPVTVIGKVPTGADGATVKVMVELQVGEQLLLEIVYETPLGTPETARETT